MALQTASFPVLPVVRIHLVINCVLVLLTLTVVALRMASRFVTSASLWWDDLLILLSVPQGVSMLVIQGLYAPMGVGYPITETAVNLGIILKLMVSYAIIYTLCISTIKLSVLFFYLRVFVHGRFRLVTKFVIVGIALYTLANILLLFFICRPFAAGYDLNVMGECGDQPTAFISIGAYNIISDVAILVLPIPMVWKLKARKQMKIGLTAIFMVGIAVSGVAVGRIFTLKTLDLDNITQTMVWVDFLSTTEVNMGILCVSLPMLGPIISRIRRRRGASKLSATPDGDNKQRQQQSSRPSRRNQPAPGVDTIALDTICADTGTHDMLAQKTRDGESSPDGSEVSLTQGTRTARGGNGGTVER